MKHDEFRDFLRAFREQHAAAQAEEEEDGDELDRLFCMYEYAAKNCTFPQFRRAAAILNIPAKAADQCYRVVRK